MKVTVRDEPNCKKILEIEVPVEDVDAEFENQLNEYRSKAKIPGFRPGKAPIDIVKSRFADSIKADVFETLIPNAYSKAIQQEKLIPLNQPELTDIKFEDGQPLSFKARIEVRPEINLKNYTGYKLKKEVKEVTDADIGEALKQLQNKHAEFTPVERKCHDNDLVVVDLIKKYDKLGALKDDKMENVEVDLGYEHVLKEFKEGLRGMSIGEMKEIELKYPDDYSDKQMAGNEIKYMAIVKEVKEKKLPELDDEFAKNYAELDNLEELKKSIRANLEKHANNESENKLTSEIIKKIINDNKFEVPESFVENYLQSVTEDFKKRYKDVDELQLRQNYRSIGEDTIRWQFIYRNIADKENIKVVEKDRAEWIKQFAAGYNMSEQTARETLGKAGKFDDIEDNLLEKKVLDFIKKNSKITT